jgi:hypothetical protein
MAYDLRSKLEATLDMTGKPESLYIPKVGIYKAYLKDGFGRWVLFMHQGGR